MANFLSAFLPTLALFLKLNIYYLSFSAIGIISLLFGLYWLSRVFIKRIVVQGGSKSINTIDKRNLVSRLGLFFVGVVGSVLAVTIFVFSGIQPAGSELFWQLREIALVLALLSLPTIALNVGILLPIGRRLKAICLLGCAICVITVGWFTLVYPFEWSASGNDVVVLSTYAVGLVFLTVPVVASLAKQYQLDVQDHENRRRLYIAVGMFTSAVLIAVIGFGLFLNTSSQLPGSALFWQLREYAILLVMLALPATVASITIVLIEERGPMAAALIGGGICLVAAGWFTMVYPYEWSAVGNDVPVVSTYVGGMGLLTATMGWALIDEKHRKPLFSPIKGQIGRGSEKAQVNDDRSPGIIRMSSRQETLIATVVLLGIVFLVVDYLGAYGSTLSAIAVIGVVFGIVWLIVNFYHLYPYVQLFIAPILLRIQPTEQIYVNPVDIDDIPVDELPTIDVLLPAYKEGNVIHQSIGSIRRANYPQELINISVILEPEDTDTRSKLQELEEKYKFREVTIPAEYEEIIVPEKYPGLPNKPRALNYGFELTEGDIVGVIDAEDIVDPDLFIHVYSSLIEEGHDYTQGILDMVNEGDGWLNTIFRSEYAWWFRWLLPAFHYTDFPVPLGGTTNFCHRSVLEEISAERYRQYGSPWESEEPKWFENNGLTGKIPWDPRNVTEDFELGLFLWKEGYELGLINSVTHEESPLNLTQWIRQRTRWQKGKIYTFIQYANHRPKGLRAKYHLLLQSFLPHLAPIHVSGIVILAIFANVMGIGQPIGVLIVLAIGLAFLIQINGLHAYSYWKMSETKWHTRFIRALIIFLTLQLYWLPFWGAEHRAMGQIYSKQLNWEKTEHHGRNVQIQDSLEHTDADQLTQTQKVIIGLLILAIGLLITFGLPLWYY